jgi:hypothetical protein
VRFHSPSGPDTPGFLFLEECAANPVQCSYAQHSAPGTANQEAATFVSADVLGRVWPELDAAEMFVEAPEFR